MGQKISLQSKCPGFFLLIFDSNNNRTVFRNSFPPSPHCMCESFPKIEDQFKIVGPRRLTWSKFETEDSQISDSTVEVQSPARHGARECELLLPATDDRLNDILVQAFLYPVDNNSPCSVLPAVVLQRSPHSDPECGFDKTFLLQRWKQKTLAQSQITVVCRTF